MTSSRFFEFLFRMFSAGDTAVPAEGMQQIPLQLAARLRAGTLVTGARVSKVTRSPQSFAGRNRGPERTWRRAPWCWRSRATTATPYWGESAAGVCPKCGPGTRPRPSVMPRSKLPVNEPIILLNGEGRGAGPVNNVAVMSAVSPAYAPPGAHLVVASVVGEAPAENAALLRLDDEVRTHLRKWFGPAVDSWKTAQGLPARPSAAAAEACGVGAGPGAVGGHGRRLHVWGLPRNGLHPGGPGLGQAGRGGGGPRPAAAREMG